MTNPYIAGNPVGGSPAFVGRETILRGVLRMLESPGENAIVLFGQRRIGKTSVLQELAQRLRSAGPYHPLYFDLQDKAALPLAQVVKELAQRLAAELRLPPPPDWGASAPEAFRQKYLPYALEELPNDHSLVLLFDEFDVLDSPAKNQAGAAFFPYLRDLLTASPRLQFVFVIGRRPEDLSSLTLSVFKGVRSELISLLDVDETVDLVSLAEADGSLSWSQEAVIAVYELTGGHPFLTQQLCQEVWEQAHELDSRQACPNVTPEAVESAVSATLRSATNALEWLWSGLGPAERIVASALAGTGPGSITQAELERRLQESGVRILIGELRNAPRTLQDWDLIRPEGGGYRFRVELLRRWIAERKPLSRVQEEIDYIQPVAENLFQAAYAYYQSGQLAEALPLLQQVVRLNPNHQRGTQLLAEILLAQNRLDEARQLLDNLYQSSPSAARPRLVQTLLLQAQAKVPEDKQLELYDRVLALEPRQPEALAGQCRIWEQRGDKAVAAGDALTAMKDYEQSGTRDKYLKAALQYIVNLERVEKYEDALEQARVLWKTFPNEKARLPDLDLLQRKTQLSGLYGQGLAALEAGRKDEAAKLLAQVVGLSPSYKEATSYLHQAVTGEDVDALHNQLWEAEKARKNAERLAEASRAQLAKMQELQNRIEIAKTVAPAQTPAAPAVGTTAGSAWASQGTASFPAKPAETLTDQPVRELPPQERNEISWTAVPAQTPTKSAVGTTAGSARTSQGTASSPAKPTKTSAAQPVRKLHPRNPVDHLRLLGWLFFAPGRLQAFQGNWGMIAVQRVGKWPASILTWLPLLILCLALGLGILPHVSGSPLSVPYLGLGAVIAVAAMLTGWLGDREDNLALVVVLVVAGGVAAAVAVGVVAGVAGGVAAVVVAIAAAVVTGVMAGIVAVVVGISVAFVVPVGVAAGMAGGAAGGAAGILVGILAAVVAAVVVAATTAVLASVVDNNIKNGRRSLLAISCFAVLVETHAFLVWFSFLGGWRIFTG